MKQNDLKSAALYARVSTEEQASEGLSLQAQLDTLTQYCQLYGYRIYQQYVDSGISGKETSNRPGLLCLVSDAKKHKFDMVLVWKLSRLSRNLKDLLLLMDVFEQNHITFASYSEKFDTSSPVGRMTLQLLGSIAEFERNTIVENVRLGLEAYAKKGGRTGTVLGYDSINRTLAVNEREAEVVMMIYDLYVNKAKDLKGIADILNGSGYKTKRGKPYRSESVANIIDNPVYIGLNRHLIGTEKAYMTKGTHEPIVEMNLWNTAANLRQQEKAFRSIMESTSKSHFSGLLYCMRCKKKRNIFYSQSKGKKYRYYKCTHGGCLLNAKAAERSVDELLRQLLCEHHIQQDLVQYLKTNYLNSEIIYKILNVDLLELYGKITENQKKDLAASVFTRIEMDDAGIVTGFESRIPLYMVP